MSSAPRIDCMIAPPRSRWRSAVADAMPARRTGTEPVSECEAGVPASPTPSSDERVPEPDLPVRAAVLPEQEHREEAEQAEDIPGRSVKRAPRASMSLAERGATITIKPPRAGWPRRLRAVTYPSTFCRYCWPMNIAPISEPNTMMPATAATQNIRRAGDVEVVERVARPALADDERDRRPRRRSRGRSPTCPCRAPARS